MCSIYEADVKQVSDDDRETKVSELNRQRSQLKDEEARSRQLFVTGKLSEETYNQLRREWQEKLRHLQLTLAELEREVRFHLDDLDAAMVLMARMADLFPRLEKKQQAILLQILAKQIIVDLHGKISEHELNSPFVYLRSLVQDVSTLGNGEGGKIRKSQSECESLDEFLAGLRFEQHGKLAELPLGRNKHNKLPSD